MGLRPASDPTGVGEVAFVESGLGSFLDPYCRHPPTDPLPSSFKLLFHLAEGGRTIREAFPNKEEGEEGRGIGGGEEDGSAGPSITISKINKTCGES